MNAGRGRRLLGAVALAVLVLTGCTVKEPGPDAWRDQARQSLDDVASEVATARLTLEQLDADRLPASYGVTTLADAEQAVSTAEESLSSLQAPTGLGKRADQVLGLIGRAADAVQRAREAVVDGKFHAPALVRLLNRLQQALDKRKSSL